MTALVLPLCSVLLFIASALALYRLFAGPTLLDRIIGFDMAAICIIGLIILLSTHWRSSVFLEIMLIFSLLGFLGTVAFVSYLHGDPRRLNRFKAPDSESTGGPK